MKKHALAAILVSLIVCITNPSSGWAIHAYKGYRNLGFVREYKFNDVSENSGYLITFPSKQIEARLAAEDLEKWDIEYGIYTSVADAEMAMIERLEMCELHMYNIIDSPLGDEQIGDNCWYQLANGFIQFIRNNVMVSIKPKIFSAISDRSIATSMAREIDKLILQSEKVQNAESIPAPVFQSIEILSKQPTTSNEIETATIKVNAIDKKAQQLFIRQYLGGLSIFSKTGIITLCINKETDYVKDLNKVRIKLWIWNEDHVISLVQVEIPL